MHILATQANSPLDCATGSAIRFSYISFLFSRLSLFSFQCCRHWGLTDCFRLQDPQRAVPDCSGGFPESLFTPFPPPLGSLRHFFSQRPTARGSWLVRKLSGVSFHSISDSARVSQAIFLSKTRGARFRKLSEFPSPSDSTAARVSLTVFPSKTRGARLRRLSDHSSASISITARVSQAFFLSKTRGARFLAAPKTFRSLFSLHFRLRSGLSDIFSLKDPRRAVQLVVACFGAT